MPRPHLNVTICGHAQTECAKQMVREFRLQQNSKYKCSECLSGCFAVSYDSILSTAQIFDRSPLVKDVGLTSKNTTILQIYYDKSTFRSQRKEELVGFTDFLCKHFCS